MSRPQRRVSSSLRCIPHIPRSTTHRRCSRLDGGHMEGKSEIGSSIVIKGQVSAQEDLLISGRVEGSIAVEGHALTVNPGAHLAADVEALAIDVQGSVSGVFCASELISLGTSAQG